MLLIAQEAAGNAARIDALTAGFGAALICDEASLAIAADAVAALCPALQRSRPDGVIIAAFGDPAHERLARELACPVVGIAQAGPKHRARMVPMPVRQEHGIHSADIEPQAVHVALKN